MQQLVGQTLDRYQVISLLGEGGMGAVYKARDLTLQRDVAIKVMHTHFARQRDFQERFLQEARIAARLDHPGIVQVFDFGSALSQLYIVMEFIPGANLRKLLNELKKQRKWIVKDEAVQLVRQVAIALDYAHRHGILHRDLKPSNIMLEPEPSEGLPYRPVLTDLGLAKLVEGGLMTREGTSMGTPVYMSPEQALGQTTDARSDVYSLGVLLYELTVGRIPFPAKTITEAIKYHTKELPPLPRSLLPDFPELLEKIILRSLEKNPDDRYNDAAAMAKALELGVEATTKIASVSTALGSAVSLMTQYQQSIVEQRGASIIEEFPDIPAGGSRDRIQVLAKDKTTHTISMKPSGMTIGRADDNDIVLDDSKVSRNHARIEYDGTNYRVTDLDSTNGTFLGKAKLLPGLSEIWSTEVALRIGDAWLRVMKVKGEGITAQYGFNGTQIDPSLVLSSAGEGRVGVVMDSTQLTVAPGKSTKTSITVLNQGSVVDHFVINVSGIPANWIPSRPPVTRLMPGQTSEISFLIQPPRNPQSRAGRYPLTIRVSSQDTPDQFTELKTTLTLATFTQFSSELHPQKVRSGHPARVTVSNLGNIQESYTITFQDRAAELAFNPQQTQLRVPEGQVAATEFRSALKNRRWFGGAKNHPFACQVTSPQGESQSHSGEIISRGLIPTWIIPVLAIMCLLLVGVIALFISFRNTQSTQATETAAVFTETAVSEKTAIAFVVESTYQAGTAITDFIANANEATIQAMTATAVWLAGDDDRDGLTNQQEMELGTLPLVRDTDEDGLDDGDEINWGTDPLIADTDGDGLKDGAEVSRGIDPLNPDTDGDGMEDNVDEFPGQVPTNTPTPSPVPSFTPTPTPTQEDTPTPTQVTPTPQGGSNQFAFVYDNEILIMNSDGSGRTQLTDFDNQSVKPDWSPDGSKIVFVSSRDSTGHPEIYVMNANGSNQTRLTFLNSFAYEPDWSPDESKIAFSLGSGGNKEIYVMNRDGSNIIQLTNNSFTDDEPDWSPDGSRIVFVSNRDGGGYVDYEIYVMNADGSGQTRLTINPGGNNHAPAWSPNGQKIAFDSRRDDNAEIYLMNVNGSGLIRLTNNSVHDANPAWSPDGNLLAFTSRTNGTDDIYTMNSNGSGVTRVTNNNVYDIWPAWRP